MEHLIRLKNVSKYYSSEGNVVLALRDINLEIHEHEFVAITGESGSGKSTLLNVLSGMDTYEEGEFYFKKEETSYFDSEDWENYRRNSVGFVFQNYNLIDSYTVIENVQAALVIAGVSKKEQRTRAAALLKKVGLEKHHKQKASKLSGGEKQRLSIARALAKDVPIIFADEPTGNLDSENSAQIVELFAEIAKERTVIVVTHDYESVAKYVTHKVRLFDGEIVENKILKEPEGEVQAETTEDTQTLIEEEVSIKSRFVSVSPLAFKNVKNQPKKTFLLILVAFFATLFIGFIYVSYLNTSSDTFGWTPDNYYFLNSGEDRIVVSTKDKSMFTNEQITNLSNIGNVNTVIPYDLVYGQTAQVYSNLEVRYDSVAYGPLRSIRQLTQKDLLYGRLPTAANEIVVGESYNMDDPETYLNHPVRMSLESYVGFSYMCQPYYDLDLVIVGITASANYMSDIYVQDEMLDYFQQSLLIQRSERLLTIDYTLDFEIQISDQYYTVAKDPNVAAGEARLEFYYWINPDLSLDIIDDTNISYKNTTLPIQITEIEKLEGDTGIGCRPDSYVLYIHPDTFDAHFNQEVPQVTLIVKDVTSMDRTLTQIHNMDLNAFSPANIDMPNYSDIGGLILGIFSLLYMAVSLLILYVLLYVIIRTILKSKVNDSNILRSIGFKSNEIKLINIIELVTVFLIGTTIGVIVLFVLKEFVRIFSDLFSLFKLQHFFILFGINLAIAIFISLKYHKTLQEKSVFIQMKAK